ncbi:HRDC domain-containing protein [Deinococcus reticulitermitis]|nr:HRDC domain-containing protein [Deinococcus reticulitermitis]
MTDPRPTRPDARLVRLHAERGNPLARLEEALAALEEADWGLLFSGEGALARQLAALLGPGTLRVDGRLPLSRAALAEAGLAAADLHGDLHGARAAWLLEPDPGVLERARRAGVPVIVDGTLAPGGGWLRQGASFVVYRDALTLSGHADAPLAALFGQGEVPAAAAPAPSDLAVALALRDVATLPLRLARSARTAAQLAERLGAQARAAGPTALLLAHDAAADTAARPGGVLAAARHVPEGLLLTPGLEEVGSVLALLRQEAAPRPAPEAREERRGEERTTRFSSGREEGYSRRGVRREERERRDFRERDSRDGTGRDGAGRDSGGRDSGGREGAGRERERPRFDRPHPERPNEPEAPARRAPDSQTPPAPERVAFEAPQPPATTSSRPAREAAGLPQPDEAPWQPEIVYSDLTHPPVPLTHTVSSGPDAAPLDFTPPLAEDRPAPVTGPSAASDEAPALPTPAPEPEPERAAPPAPEPELPALAPDLPATPESAGPDNVASDLTGEQAAIYARLREWRNAEAKRQEISRFIIASNATLAEIARRVPYTLEDLRAVRGMGPGRLDKYGNKILEVVRG